jgi:glycosyltransferase involved in cell wall biosynthesis
LKNPLITVLLPFYNAEKYLEKSIQSVLQQTFKDFELLLINDGSTDCSEKIINQFKDPRIVYVQKFKNEGIVKCLNYGIEIAKGKYIARMDADDICTQERLLDQYTYLENYPNIDVVGSWVKVINTSSIEIDKWKLPSSTCEFNFCIYFKSDPRIAHPAAMYRTDTIKEIGCYDPNLNYSGVEDADLWFRLIKENKQIVNIPKYLLNYRIHDNQISKKKNEFGIKMYQTSYKNLLENITLKKINDKLIKNIINLKNLNILERIEVFIFFNKLLFKLIQSNRLSSKKIVSSYFKIVTITFFNFKTIF